MSMIDLLTESKIWESRQIAKRAESEVRKLFSSNQELILNRKITGVAQGVYVMTPQEEAQATAFQVAAFAAQTAAREAEADNVRLAFVLGYEQAQRDQAAQTLRIDGRDEVPAVEEELEEIDPVTGIVLVAYVAPVAAIPAIEPLALTVESSDDEGNPITISNPDYDNTVALRDSAKAVIDGASQETLDLTAARNV